MSTHKDISDTLLGLYRRRPGVFGKWMPTQHWLKRMKLDGVDNSKLQKSLETCGTLMTKIEDSTHGFLYIEIVKKKLPAIGTRWFICCSTPKERNLYVGNYDKVLFGKTLTASWERWCNDQDEDNDVLEAAPVQATPSPPQPNSQPTTTTTPPTRPAVSPTMGSPQALREDNDLHEFFRSIIAEEYFAKDDLFRPTITSIALNTKIKSFGMRLAAAANVSHFDSHYQPPEPITYSNRDITKLEPCPLLNKKYLIPMCVPAMSEVAQALYNLSTDVPEILHLSKYSGSKGHGKRLIAIIPSTDRKHLYQNAKQWMESIVDNATTDESTSYDVVKALIRMLHTADPLAFNHVAAIIPQVGHKLVKLDPEFQQAMPFKANINKSQVRTLKSYICAANIDILQPETVMSAMESNDFVRPIAVEFREGKGKRKRVAWHIPVDRLLEYNANKALKAESFEYDDLDKAHVILVGDHGQGAFRMMVTLLLITRKNRRRSNANEYIGSKLALEVDDLCGYIQCVKDTYSISKETIAAPIDHGIRNIKQTGRVTIYRDSLDNNAVKLCFGNTHTQNTVLASANVEVFMVGDLAFYSMVLGKESMANYWCWRCPLAKTEWTDNTDVRVGADWTQQSLRAHLERLRSGELNRRDAQHVRGVKDEAILGIEPRNIIVPSLHNNELFVNTPMKSFMKWIHNRIEQLHLALLEARLEYVDALIQLEMEQEMLANATAPLAALEAEHKSLKPTKRNGSNRYLYPEHEDDWNEASIASVCQVLGRRLQTTNNRHRQAFERVG